MLDGFERRLTAVVADALVSRTSVAVAQTTDAPPVPAAANRGAVAVAVTSAAPVPVFADDVVRIEDGPTSRRVFPVELTAQIVFARRGAGGADAQVRAARTLLLRDVSLVAHALGARSFATGNGFEATGPDPGFEVRAFALSNAALSGQRDDQSVRASLTYQGLAMVWPPVAPDPEGVIGTVAPLLQTLPLTIVPDDPIVSVGGSTTVRIRTVSGRRLASEGPPAPPQLALLVESELPPSERGAIATGAPGSETGVRLVPADGLEVAVAYQAPTGAIGETRSERVAVHLAHLDGTRGIFLGSAAIVLADGAG